MQHCKQNQEPAKKFAKKFPENACKIKNFMYNKIDVEDGAQVTDPIFTACGYIIMPESRRIEETPCGYTIMPESRRIEERIVR